MGKVKSFILNMINFKQLLDIHAETYRIGISEFGGWERALDWRSGLYSCLLPHNPLSPPKEHPHGPARRLIVSVSGIKN